MTEEHPLPGEPAVNIAVTQRELPVTAVVINHAVTDAMYLLARHRRSDERALYRYIRIRGPAGKPLQGFASSAVTWTSFVWYTEAEFEQAAESGTCCAIVAAIRLPQ